VGLHGLRELLGDLAVVEVIRVLRERGEGAGEVRLFEGFARGVEVSVALEDASGFWELGEVLGVQRARLFGGQHVAVGRERDGGRHVLRECQLAVVLLRVGEAGDRARDADRFVTDGAEVGNDVAMRVLVHSRRGGLRSALAEVDEVGRAGVVAIEQEASAADVACGRQHDGEREADGDGCVDCVAALLENPQPGIRGIVLDGDDHGVFRLLRGGVWEGKRCGEQEREGFAHGGLRINGGTAFGRIPEERKTMIDSVFSPQPTNNQQPIDHHGCAIVGMVRRVGSSA
jgi:hypothetical protein